MTANFLRDNADMEFVELTEHEICQINGSADAGSSVQGGLYPEINNDPP